MRIACSQTFIQHQRTNQWLISYKINSANVLRFQSLRTSCIRNNALGILWRNIQQVKVTEYMYFSGFGVDGARHSSGLMKTSKHSEDWHKSFVFATHYSEIDYRFTTRSINWRWLIELLFKAYQLFGSYSKPPL